MLRQIRDESQCGINFKKQQITIGHFYEVSVHCYKYLCKKELLIYISDETYRNISICIIL